MPRLIEIQEQYRELADRFQILAMHDTTVAGFDQLDQKTERVRRSHWRGRDLPFPVLLDSTGATLVRYGVQAFPTSVLIDPEGRIAGTHAEGRLARVLAELREQRQREKK